MPATKSLTYVFQGKSWEPLWSRRRLYQQGLRGQVLNFEFTIQDLTHTFVLGTVAVFPALALLITGLLYAL